MSGSSHTLGNLQDRSLADLARIVRNDWTDTAGYSNVYFGAVPYLQAMSTLDSVDDMYGYDSGTSVVAYFLSNAKTWKGDTARAVKAELKRRIGR